jgi:hypothetical protein
VIEPALERLVSTVSRHCSQTQRQNARPGQQALGDPSGASAKLLRGLLEGVLDVIDPNVSELTTQLAEIVTRNAASAVTSRISAIRTRKLDQQAMNELIELVNDLIADKNELIGVATAFEQELVAQRISDKDITYITTTLLPVVERLANFADDAEQTRDALDAIKSLITPETLTIMQLVGFNFRRAIGEPLTTLIERLILSRVPAPDQSAELQALQLRQQTAYFQALVDPDAREVLTQG